MIVAGVDIGSLSTKAVLMVDNEIRSSAVILTGPDSAAGARAVMEKTLAGTGLTIEDMEYIVATGYGRVVVPFANANITEISCHARGSNYFFPEVRTILDMGGQDCKAIRCDGNGKVTKYLMNDKCAAGTGRYLERVAQAVDMELGDIGPLSLELVEKPVHISSHCAVFAQSEIISFLREGKHVHDILAGACESISERVGSLLQRVGVEEAFSISGGVAKNIGVVRRVEERLGMKAHVAFDSQIVGAVGAALFARDRLIKQRAAVAAG